MILKNAINFSTIRCLVKTEQKLYTGTFLLLFAHEFLHVHQTHTFTLGLKDPEVTTALHSPALVIKAIEPKLITSVSVPFSNTTDIIVISTFRLYAKYCFSGVLMGVLFQKHYC